MKILNDARKYIKRLFKHKNEFTIWDYQSRRQKKRRAKAFERLLDMQQDLFYCCPYCGEFTKMLLEGERYIKSVIKKSPRSITRMEVRCASCQKSISFIMSKDIPNFILRQYDNG